MDNGKSSARSPSQQFLRICTKCKDEEESSDTILDEMRSLIEEHGTKSIDLNYLTDSDDFPIKYIIKYSRPKIMQFILDTFNDEADYKNWRINLYVVQYFVVKHNVMHLMVKEMYGGAQWKKNTSDLIDILFDDQNEDRLRPHGLLYQSNDDGNTPIQYARKRNFHEIAQKLEELKYVHIHDLLCSQCNLAYEVAHCIVEYTFLVVHRDKLEGLKHRWLDDVIINPAKSRSDVLKDAEMGD